MRRITLAIILFTAAACVQNANGSDTKVKGRLYSHWTLDMSDSADSENEFALGRSYLTVTSKISEYSSVRITTDMRETEDVDGKTRYDIIVKYGYLDWKPKLGHDRLKIRFGLQPTPYIDLQNKLWGRRYLSKTVGDLRGFITSSDLGVSVYLALGEKEKYGSLALAVFNGTSYSNLGEANKQKDINLFARLTPFTASDNLKKSTLVAQYYKGIQNVLFDATTLAEDYVNDIFSVGGLLAYRELFHLGADLNWHTEGMGAGADEITESGVSIHSTLFLAEFADDAPAMKTLNLFGRFDLFDPNTDSGSDNDGEKHLIIGVECNPTKGLKVSVNFRATSYDDDTKDTKKQLYLNTLFKF